MTGSLFDAWFIVPLHAPTHRGPGDVPAVSAAGRVAQPHLPVHDGTLGTRVVELAGPRAVFDAALSPERARLGGLVVRRGVCGARRRRARGMATAIVVPHRSAAGFARHRPARRVQDDRVAGGRAGDHRGWCRDDRAPPFRSPRLGAVSVRVAWIAAVPIVVDRLGRHLADSQLDPVWIAHGAGPGFTVLGHTVFAGEPWQATDYLSVVGDLQRIEHYDLARRTDHFARLWLGPSWWMALVPAPASRSTWPRVPARGLCPLR